MTEKHTKLCSRCGATGQYRCAPCCDGQHMCEMCQGHGYIKFFAKVDFDTKEGFADIEGFVDHILSRYQKIGNTSHPYIATLLVCFGESPRTIDTKLGRLELFSFLKNKGATINFEDITCFLDEIDPNCIFWTIKKRKLQLYYTLDP